MNIDVGYKGRFNVVVRNADGSVKQDYGWQDNLITDEGMNLLSYVTQTTNKGTQREPHGSSIFGQLAVGSGTIEPSVTDKALTQLEAFSIRADNQNIVQEIFSDTRPNILKETYTAKYIFNNINNKNITELGLVWVNNSTIAQADYCLYTHALIRDKQNAISSITVLQGEILEVNYAMDCYYDYSPKKTEIHIPVEENGGVTDKVYDVVVQPIAFNESYTGRGVTLSNYNNQFEFYGVNTSVDGDLNTPYDFTRIPVFSKNSINTQDAYNREFNKLVAQNPAYMGSYSVSGAWDYSIAYAPRVYNYKQGINTCNITFSPYGANFKDGIRCIRFPISTYTNSTVKFVLQCFFAEKGSSRGIMKTNKQTISFTIQCNISRYEGTP
jgi:hypothetical protein